MEVAPEAWGLIKGSPKILCKKGTLETETSTRVKLEFTGRVYIVGHHRLDQAGYSVVRLTQRQNVKFTFEADEMR